MWMLPVEIGFVGFCLRGSCSRFFRNEPINPQALPPVRAFLGLGQQLPAPSWGSMLNAAQRFLTQAPWLAVFPGAAIFLAVFSFNLIGDGLRDALDPRSK